MEHTCKNCEIPLTAGYKFCPNCSQNAHLHRLSLHEVFHEAIHYFTHADKGIFQLLRDLTIKTGGVAREYVDGKRKKYYPPLSFFLLVVTVYVLAINLDGSPQTETIKEQPELSHIKDPVKKQKMVEMFRRRDEAVIFIQKHSNIVSMLILPLSTFFFWLFYRKGRYNYTEHMIAGMYMSGFTTLLFVLAIVLNLIFKLPVNYVYTLYFVMQIMYFANFYYRFMDHRTTGKAVKAFFASFISVLCLFMASGIIVFLYMMKIF
ncbi:MAG TPA: DUF3667 domain-containing protein [Flavobacterium sp.]